LHETLCNRASAGQSAVGVGVVSFF
jgi:hypothetical protein